MTDSGNEVEDCAGHEGDGVGAALATAAAVFPAAEAERLAFERYGLDGKAEWLWGEKDSNFRLTLGDGTAYFLKMLHPGEDPATTAMHSQALLHVEAADPGVPVQRIVPTLDGFADCRVTDAEGKDRGMRMVTFLKGVSVGEVRNTPRQRFNVGVMLGRMQKALDGFSHVAAGQKINWDLTNALEARPLLATNPDAAERSFLTAIFDRFEAEVLPRLRELPAQVIHNDFNMANVLVDPDNPDEVSGIIDFGDMVHAPNVFDVAIGAAYEIGEEADPVAALCEFLAGYASVRKLTPLEAELLYPSMVTRMAMRLAIPEWRATLFPERASFICRHSSSIRGQFARLRAVPEATIRERIIATCC